MVEIHRIKCTRQHRHMCAVYTWEFDTGIETYMALIWSQCVCCGCGWIPAPVAVVPTPVFISWPGSSGYCSWSQSPSLSPSLSFSLFLLRPFPFTSLPLFSPLSLPPPSLLTFSLSSPCLSLSCHGHWVEQTWITPSLQLVNYKMVPSSVSLSFFSLTLSSSLSLSLLLSFPLSPSFPHHSFPLTFPPPLPPSLPLFLPPSLWSI